MSDINIFVTFQSEKKNQLGNKIDAICKKIGRKIFVHRYPCDDKAGSRVITEQITDKIKNCDIFIADLTCVSKSDCRYKYNENVMYELGFAKNILNEEQIIIITDEDPEKLPFDIRSMRVSMYNKIDNDGNNWINKSIEYVDKFNLKKNKNFACIHCLISHKYDHEKIKIINENLFCEQCENLITANLDYDFLNIRNDNKFPELIKNDFVNDFYKIYSIYSEFNCINNKQIVCDLQLNIDKSNNFEDVQIIFNNYLQNNDVNYALKLLYLRKIYIKYGDTIWNNINFDEILNLIWTEHIFAQNSFFNVLIQTISYLCMVYINNSLIQNTKSVNNVKNEFQCIFYCIVETDNLFVIKNIIKDINHIKHKCSFIFEKNNINFDNDIIKQLIEIRQCFYLEKPTSDDLEDKYTIYPIKIYKKNHVEYIFANNINIENFTHTNYINIL